MFGDRGWSVETLACLVPQFKGRADQAHKASLIEALSHSGVGQVTIIEYIDALMLHLGHNEVVCANMREPR